MTTYREEDYLEAILHVVNRKGYAKVTDISKHLGCSAATVTEMFSRLSERGLVNYEKYGGVTLTDEGRKVGTEIDARHQLIRDFLLVLGVPEEVAEIARAQWNAGLHTGILVVVPPPADVAVPREKIEGLIQQAVQEAEEQGIHGAKVTPFLLARVSQLSGGESMKANLALLRNNARVSARIAKAF